MKEKFNKNHLFTSAIITVLLLTIAFTSCEKETTPDNKYTDAEYLDLEFYNKNRMTDKDYEKIFEAATRLEAKRVNGLYQLREVTPEELNISLKLFKHVTYIFNYTNRARISRLHNNKKRVVRLKSDDPEDQESDTTYCASHCVSALSFWTSFAKAKKYSDEQYGVGKGVPPEKMDEFIKHFLPKYKAGLLVSDLQNATSRKAIVTFGRGRNDDGVYEASGHAAIFISYSESSGIAIVEDADTGNREWVPKEDIAKIYYK